MTQRTTRTRTRAWRCRSCRLLLGLPHHDGVEVRFKEAGYFVRGGSVSCLCRRCNTPNEFTPPSRRSQVR